MKEITTRALRLNVLRDVALTMDCTRGGVTSTHERLTLVGYVREPSREIVPLPSAVPTTITEDDAPVVLCIRPGIGGATAHLVPLIYDEDREAWCYQPGGMAGGNYATTGDSRVSELVSDLLGHRFSGALSVHDRREP